MATIQQVISIAAPSIKAASSASGKLNTGNVQRLIGYATKSSARPMRAKATENRHYAFSAMKAGKAASLTPQSALAPKRKRDIERAKQARKEYNALKRRVGNFLRKQESSGISSYYQMQAQQLTQQLREVLAETDISGVKWAKQIRQHITPLKSQLAYAQQLAKRAKAPTKKAMLEQMRLASSGAPSTLGQYGQAKVKMFWSATIDLWQGQEDRVSAVVKGLGAADLQDAYLYVMENQGEALRELYEDMRQDGLLEEILSTEAASYYDDGGGADDTPGYPSWMYAVTAASRPDELMA